jgi:hypothetical protein
MDRPHATCCRRNVFHIRKAMRDIDDEARKNDWVRAVLDVPGVGGGVVDRLAELEPGRALQRW